MNLSWAALLLVAGLTAPVLAQSPAPAAHSSPEPARSPAPAAAHAQPALPETFVAPTGQTMRRYVVGLLSRGPSWTPGGTPETQKLQEGHLANIQRMAELRKLVAAGPMGGDGDLRGIFIFACPLEEAQALAADDPAVKAGRLSLELLMWWGPVGIGDQYRKDVAAGIEPKMAVHPFGLLLKGPNEARQSTEESATIQAAHLARIVELHRTGQMIAAGPLETRTERRGIFVFAPGMSLDDAKALAAEDPAVKSGRLVIELHPWWTVQGTVPPLPAKP